MSKVRHLMHDCHRVNTHCLVLCDHSRSSVHKQNLHTGMIHVNYHLYTRESLMFTVQCQHCGVYQSCWTIAITYQVH